jgi:hypothetical protein
VYRLLTIVGGEIQSAHLLVGSIRLTLKKIPRSRRIVKFHAT